MVWAIEDTVQYVCEELVSIFIQDKTIPNKTKMAKETLPRFQLMKCKTRWQQQQQQKGYVKLSINMFV